MAFYNTAGGRAPILNQAPTPSANLFGSEAQAAEAAGWTNKFGDTWTNSSKPGQFLTTNSLKAMLAKQGQAATAMSPGTYNPGIDYTAAVQPYLSQMQSQIGGANALVGSGPQEVSRNNEYETRLRQLMNNPDSISDTGAYKFAFNQGQQAIERSAAAKGMSGSGNVLAELMNYGQGMASQQYGTEADRLAGLSGQQKNYLLGLRGAATSDYNAKVNAAQSSSNSLAGLGGLALSAAKAKSDDYWNAQQIAQNAGVKTGYFNGMNW
jgi:hypothetical protein